MSVTPTSGSTSTASTSRGPSTSDREARGTKIYAETSTSQQPIYCPRSAIASATSTHTKPSTLQAARPGTILAYRTETAASLSSLL